MIDLKRLRGSHLTTPTAAAYIGPVAELLVDTDTWCVRVQDGTTAGGHPICPSTTTTGIATVHLVASGTSDTITTLATPVTLSKWTSTAAGAKTQTIPAASGFAGYTLIVKMAPGMTADTMTISPSAGTIDQGASYLQVAPGSVTLIADAVNNDWVAT